MRTGLVIGLFAAGCAGDSFDDLLDGGSDTEIDAAVEDQANPCTTGCTVSTVAGDGSEGLADGQADRAAFARPTGVALTADGDTVVADMRNHVIRSIKNDNVSVIRLTVSDCLSIKRTTAVPA